tara:strand:- start:392 stop:514 length:123 start_codon:yes stop_codon:yes gene_type:complete
VGYLRHLLAAGQANAAGTPIAGPYLMDQLQMRFACMINAQ